MSLLNELKRRNVFRVGAAYTVVSWLIIQVAETIFPLFDYDDSVARTVVIVLAICFIPTLIFAWVFELTPEGLKKEKDVDGTYGWTQIPEDPHFRNLKTNPRWQALLTRVGVSDGQLAAIEFNVDPARLVSK